VEGAVMRGLERLPMKSVGPHIRPDSHYPTEGSRLL
jgi:hypothetical protein